MSHRKKTSRPDLSSRQAGQCVLAQGGDYTRTSFLSIRDRFNSSQIIKPEHWLRIENK
jgi:hypothetical protein